MLYIALLLGSQLAWMRIWPNHPLNTWNDSKPLDLELHWQKQAEWNNQFI